MTAKTNIAFSLPDTEIFPAAIKGVEPGGAAEVAGVRPGDMLLRMNGQAVTDVLAYRRILTEGDVTLEVGRPAALQPAPFGMPGIGRDKTWRPVGQPPLPEFERVWTFAVSWEDPGIEFEDVLFDGIKKCANKCDFCYIHQMPKGFRKSLYIMDDDYRLSFLFGSFVTLTNLTEVDIQRILNEHLSPLYVSVHTTNQDLRQDIMNWWKLKVKDDSAVDIKGMIEQLSDIDLYTQVVLLPGRNDREELDGTVEYLSSQPNVISSAVVPIGLTGHRKNLADVRTFTADEARDTVERLEGWRRKFLEEKGTRFVFPSDEFYLLAGLPLPSEEEYEGFPMLENGVGMVRDFLTEGIPPMMLSALSAPMKVILGTGTLFAATLDQAVEPLRQIAGLDLEVRAIPNITFGDVTSVAGLLTGRCFRHAVTPGEADLLLVPPTTLRYGTELMLDDLSLTELKADLRMDIRPGGSTLGELARVILDGAQSSGPQWGMSAHAVKEDRGHA